MEFTHYKDVSAKEGAGGVPGPGVLQEFVSGERGADQKGLKICLHCVNRVSRWRYMPPGWLDL